MVVNEMRKRKGGRKEGRKRGAVGVSKRVDKPIV